MRVFNESLGSAINKYRLFYFLAIIRLQVRNSESDDPSIQRIVLSVDIAATHRNWNNKAFQVQTKYPVFDDESILKAAVKQKSSK